MNLKKAILIILIIALVVTAGCISSGNKTPVNSIDKSPADKVTGAPSNEKAPSVTQSGDVKCTVVTQYGGEITSCEGQLGVEKIHSSGSKTDPALLEDVAGTYNIAEAKLSTFPDLHFIGEATFKQDGTYEFRTNPREFDPKDGIIRYSGIYNVNGDDIVGSGKSIIIQDEKPFGNEAIDKLVASKSSENILEGRIISITSFHDSGGGENASYNFKLELIN